MGLRSHPQTIQMERSCLKQALNATSTQLSPLEKDLDEAWTSLNTNLHGTQGHVFSDFLRRNYNPALFGHCTNIYINKALSGQGVETFASGRNARS